MVKNLHKKMLNNKLNMVEIQKNWFGIEKLMLMFVATLLLEAVYYNFAFFWIILEKYDK